MQRATEVSIIVASLFFSGLTLAAGVWNSSWGTISQLESYGDDTHVIGLDLSPNPGGCSNTSLAKVRYSLSLERKEELRQVLMAAFLAGRQVKVKIDDNRCQGDYPSIYGVRVK